MVSACMLTALFVGLAASNALVIGALVGAFVAFATAAGFLLTFLLSQV